MASTRNSKTQQPAQAARQRLQALTQRAHVTLLGRAAAGMWAALTALGFRGRGVLVPANSCYIVLWAVLASDNVPVLVDVEAETGNLSRRTLEKADVPHASAVIPCHMYGLAAPMFDICAWAKARGIVVIEDAALALGAVVGGQPAGSYGDAAVFSFGLGKIIDHQAGGALVTDDPHLSREIERVLADVPRWDNALIDLTNQWHNLYWALHQYESQNPRLPALYPALFDIYRPLVAYQLEDDDWDGLPDALDDLPRNLRHRAALAALYDGALAGLPVQTLQRPPGSILWRYPLLAPPGQRDALLASLWENGFHDVTRWYPSLQPMAAALAPAASQTATPNADHLSASIINLPLDASTNEATATAVGNAIARFFTEAAM